MLGQGPCRDQPEAVVERPRADRRDDLVRLGRGEDEPQVRRRLLDQLEQGVGRLVGELVGLVDDVDLEPAGRRGVDGLLAQVPGVVDAAVRGRVELHHVHRAGAVGGQLDAAAALPARARRVGPCSQFSDRARMRAVDVLPHPRGPGEQVRVVGAAGLQGARQRLGHVLLADHLGQRARPVGPVERQCHVAHPNGARRQHGTAVWATGWRRRRDPQSPSHPHLGITHTRCNYGRVTHRAGRERAYSAPPAAVGAVGSAPPPAPVSRAR